MPITQLNTALAWSTLNILTKKRYDALLREFGSLDDAWEQLDETLLKNLGCRQDTIMKTLNEVEELDLARHENVMRTMEITFLTIEDEAYPQALLNLPDPPVFLFARGNLKLLNRPQIAIVGTRSMSLYGKRVVEEVVPAFVHADLVTVSGLAAGIDAEVAKQTLAAGGATVAVLGHGLANIYPKSNARLAEEIVQKGGLLLTEFPLHVGPSKFTFPARNRIIAGLSHGTVVVEAAAQSGSLITASLALEYGRDVFAVPGSIFDPNMEGTHQLIFKGGAQLITGAEDVLRTLGIVSREKEHASRYKAQTPDEQVLLANLHTMPQSADELMEKTGMPIAAINATLTLMELKGGAKNVGMGTWVRS
jgi:DNA processing protein